MSANQKGAGLIAVAAGAAVVAALGAAALSSIQQSAGAGKTAEYRFDVQMLVAEIGVTLKNSQACFNTFKNLDATNGSGVTSIRNAADQEVFKLDLVHGHTAAKVEEFRLEDKPGFGDGVDVIAGNRGTTMFLIKFKPKEKTIFENRELFGKIRLSVRTDGARRIQSCFAVGSGDDDIWSQAANPSRIFYDSGNVGVGTAAPAEKLDVNGWVSGQSTLGSISLGGDASEYQIMASLPGPITLNNSNGGKGNMKVGEVRPEGLLHLTSADIACTPAREGSLRYRPAVKRVQVCRAGIWESMTVVQWCLPPWKYQPAHDTNDVAMWMYETDEHRQPLGSPCLRSQVRRDVGPADLDMVQSKNSSDTPPDPVGWWFQGDDSGKRRKCINNTQCRDYKDNEQ